MVKQNGRNQYSSFTDEEVRILCYDKFSHVYSRITSQTSRNQIIDEINGVTIEEDEDEIRKIFEAVVSYFDLDSVASSQCLELLANKLTQLIPEHIELVYKRGFFTKKRAVQQISVQINEWQYIVENNKSLSCYRLRVVRGIVLKTEDLILSDWIKKLSIDLAVQAQYHRELRNLF